MFLTTRTTPSLVDFTTLFGAALSMDERQGAENGLLLSRVLALSQIIEGIVLHDQLCFEWGETPDWIPYREALEATDMWRAITELKLPMSPSVSQFDTEPEVVCAAAYTASEAVIALAHEPLEDAVRYRAGTYDALAEIADRDNPTIRRYISIISESGDRELNDKVAGAIAHLKRQGTGLLGLHVMMRVCLIIDQVVAKGQANYFPHFSRQAVSLNAAGLDFEVKRWTMNELTVKREEIVNRIVPGRGAHHHSEEFSPIFLACLAEARHPFDLFEAALELRTSHEAKAYRNEYREMMKACAESGESVVRLYQLRIAEKLKDLNRYIFEGESRDEVIRVLNPMQPSSLFGWILPTFRRTLPSRREPGDMAMLFMSEVVKQSLAVVRADERLREVFRLPLRIDTPVSACTGRPGI